MLTFSKTDFAARLGVTKGRVSQLVAEGLPVQPDARVDAMAGAAWVLENLRDEKARYTRDAAHKLLNDANVWNMVQAVLAQVPEAVALGAPMAGLNRKQAERMANIALFILAQIVGDQLAELELPEMLLPHPEAWPSRINWAGLFLESGAPNPAAARLG